MSKFVCWILIILTWAYKFLHEMVKYVVVGSLVIDGDWWIMNLNEIIYNDILYTILNYVCILE